MSHVYDFSNQPAVPRLHYRGHVFNFGHPMRAIPGDRSSKALNKVSWTNDEDNIAAKAVEYLLSQGHVISSDNILRLIDRHFGDFDRNAQAINMRVKTIERTLRRMQVQNMQQRDENAVLNEQIHETRQELSVVSATWQQLEAQLRDANNTTNTKDLLDLVQQYLQSKDQMEALEEENSKLQSKLNSALLTVQGMAAAFAMASEHAQHAVLNPHNNIFHSLVPQPNSTLNYARQNYAVQNAAEQNDEPL